MRRFRGFGHGPLSPAAEWVAAVAVLLVLLALFWAAPDVHRFVP